MNINHKNKFENLALDKDADIEILGQDHVQVDTEVFNDAIA